MSDKQRRSSRLMANSLDNHNINNINTTNTNNSHYSKSNGNYFPLSDQRHYSLDAATGSSHLTPFTNMNVDYDATEGAGGLSVSSYDSIDDDRSPVDVRGYSSYHDQILPYSTTHSIYPPIPYTTDDLSHGPPGALTPSDVSSSISPPNGQIGNTKYSTSISGDRIASALGQEEQYIDRHAADEDRRRRNTAASARFRMKKKQREQTLEQSVRETAERNANLETRVTQLEMENRWLKNLVTEKHEATASRLATSHEKETSKDTTTSTDNSNSNPNSNRNRANGMPGSGQKHIQPKKKGVGTTA